MNDDRSLERAARSWIEAGPTKAPEAAVQRALSLIETTPQERDLRVPWRTSPMNRFALAGAAVATLIVVAVGGSLGLGWLPVVAPPGSTGTPQPTPSPLASISTPAAPNADHLVTVPGVIEPGHIGVVVVVTADGSDPRPLFRDTDGEPLRSALFGRSNDGTQVLVRFQDPPPEATLVLAVGDVATGTIHRVPGACPSEPCWTDFTWVTASLSPDDRSAVLSLYDDGSGRWGVGIVDLDTGATTILEQTMTRDYIGPAAMSPDGLSVAYVQSTPIEERFPRCEHADAGALLVASVSGGDPREVVPADYCAMSPAWAPDSDGILVTTAVEADAAGTEISDVYLASATEAPPEQLTSDGRSISAAWTTDGEISYAVTQPNEFAKTRVWILDPTTRERREISGDLVALRAAGCLACHYSLAEPANGSLFVGGLAMWPRD